MKDGSLRFAIGLGAKGILQLKRMFWNRLYYFRIRLRHLFAPFLLCLPLIALEKRSGVSPITRAVEKSSK